MRLSGFLEGNECGIWPRTAPFLALSSMTDFYRGLNGGSGNVAFQVLRSGNRRTLELTR